jgi:DNA-binding NtrC family response regulator
MSASGVAFAGRRDRRVLVASSRVEFREHLVGTLRLASCTADEAAGGADALLKLHQSEYDALLLDPCLQDLDVGELIATVRARYPELNVVLLEREDVDEQLPIDLQNRRAECAAADLSGQSDPDGEESLDNAIEAFTRKCAPKGEGTPSTAVRVEPLPGMIGTSEKMQQISRLARLVAPRDTTVLIVGATGTGKELVARGIHALSRRSSGPFVVVNCAAIPESLLEAELFGFTRGAFTGAFQSRLGRIHAAHGGTLLLDEVGELPLSMQAKLLRFVQEGEVQRLGSADVFRVDTRLIAATNADLLQRVREKQFREDLYYRLTVFPLDLPPLSNRRGDILPLAEHFLQLLCRKAGMAQKTFGPEAQELLSKHTWPGNVRELQHSVERAFVLSEANLEIRAEDLAMHSEASLSS